MAKAGYVAGSTTSTTFVECGFRPKYLCIVNAASTSNNISLSLYNELFNTDKSKNGYAYFGTSYSDLKSLPHTTNDDLNSVTDTGFVLNQISGSTWPGYYYFAVGDI